ncbi:MAG TPA: sigma-70 family RNA polymerase sigma factor [Streptosporangiaceae bacterium]
MDQEAWFTALYQAYYDAVLRYAARRIDPETARDVASETFLVVWRRRKAVPADPAVIEPWLYKVASYSLANRKRSRQRAEQLTMHLADTFDPAKHSGDHADAIAERARLTQALERLSPQDQEILRLIAWEELDLAYAAAAMGCSRPTAAVRLHRARRRMTQALEAIDNSGAAVNITGASTKVAEEMR